MSHIQGAVDVGEFDQNPDISLFYIQIFICLQPYFKRQTVVTFEHFLHPDISIIADKFQQSLG